MLSKLVSCVVLVVLIGFINPWIPIATAGGADKLIPLDSLPSDFPSIALTIDSLELDSISPGNIFLSNFTFGGPGAVGNYLMVLSSEGTPIYYRKVNGLTTDLKVQPNGMLTYYDGSAQCFYELDTNYAIVDSFRCQKESNTGLTVATDVHDLQVLTNGHVLMLGNDSSVTDMRSFGGDSAAIVVAPVIQEFDASRNLVFEWRGIEYFSPLDATGVDLTQPLVDFVHSNSIQIDTDGNILLSSRHLDEVTKIDRTTGEIIWRFGGVHNQFTFVGDTLPFSHQHNARRLPNGNITLFDNGNLHNPPFSRALEYRLDLTNMTATKVWEYQPPGGTYSGAMGNVERLSNGNTFIGWGANNNISASEVLPNGHTLFQFALGSNYSYRAVKQPWGYIHPIPAAGILPQQILSMGAIANFPNPFRGATSIYYSLDRQQDLTLTIEDGLGRTIATLANGFFGEGKHFAVFNASNLPAGTYNAVLRTSDAVRTCKMMVIR